MWLQKLPGFKQTPYGWECRILRLMPKILASGTVVPVLVAVLVRGLPVDNPDEAARRIQMVDFLMIGLVSFFWFCAATVVIACTIVWLMKGPAYVADAYPPPPAEEPQR